MEDTLAEHPAVAMAGVVGRPDPRLGGEILAFVSLRPGHSVSPRSSSSTAARGWAATSTHGT